MLNMQAPRHRFYPYFLKKQNMQSKIKNSILSYPIPGRLVNLVLRFSNSMKLKLTFPWRIFLLAVALRLLPVLLTRSLGIGLDDMFQYDMLARSLAAGNGFRWYAYEDLKMLEPYVDFDLSSIEYDPARGVPTSFRAPLYPSFLALIYWITGTGMGRFFAVRLVQAGLSAILAPLTYHVSRRLFPENRAAAVISAWIVACYPLLIIYPIGLATENLFFLLVLAAFYSLLKIPDSQSPISTALLSGFFLALAALTRSVILPFAGLADFMDRVHPQAKTRCPPDGADHVGAHLTLGNSQFAPASKTNWYRIFDGLQPVPWLPSREQRLLYIWPLPRFDLHPRRCRARPTWYPEGARIHPRRTGTHSAVGAQSPGIFLRPGKTCLSVFLFQRFGGLYSNSALVDYCG